MNVYDWLIRGGRVIDPANQLDELLDVAIQGGRIVKLAAELDPSQGKKVYDATGQLVVPGLVDLHAHVYHLVTPLGVDPDHYCLGRGVTTAVDAGSGGLLHVSGLPSLCCSQLKNAPACVPEHLKRGSRLRRSGW